MVFSDVLWTQLHFPGFDVITSLNEGCIEHYTAHRLVGKASMLENDLYVPAQDAALLLLGCEEENNTTLGLCVLFGSWIGEDFLNV